MLLRILNTFTYCVYILSIHVHLCTVQQYVYCIPDIALILNIRMCVFRFLSFLFVQIKKWVSVFLEVWLAKNKFLEKLRAFFVVFLAKQINGSFIYLD